MPPVSRFGQNCAAVEAMVRALGSPQVGVMEYIQYITFPGGGHEVHAVQYCPRWKL